MWETILMNFNYNGKISRFQSFSFKYDGAIFFCVIYYITRVMVDGRPTIDHHFINFWYKN